MGSQICRPVSFPEVKEAKKRGISHPIGGASKFPLGKGEDVSSVGGGDVVLSVITYVVHSLRGGGGGGGGRSCPSKFSPGEILSGGGGEYCRCNNILPILRTEATL